MRFLMFSVLLAESVNGWWRNIQNARIIPSSPRSSLKGKIQSFWKFPPLRTTWGVWLREGRVKQIFSRIFSKDFTLWWFWILCICFVWIADISHFSKSVYGLVCAHQFPCHTHPFVMYRTLYLPIFQGLPLLTLVPQCTALNKQRICYWPTKSSFSSSKD